jgi:uncharacterized protein
LTRVSFPRSRSLLVIPAALVIAVIAAPFWLSMLGTSLTVNEPLAPADVAVVLEGTGATATQAAEAWREEGVVRDVVIVEAPIKTHALVTYWSDLVRRGIASPAPTPAEHLDVVRAPSTQATQQARAALAPLQARRAASVLVLGGGGIGSRLVERDLAAVLGPAGISLRMVSYGTAAGRDPARWYLNADDRRAVLDTWLQLAVPFLSGYDDVGT